MSWKALSSGRVSAPYIVLLFAIFAVFIPAASELSAAPQARVAAGQGAGNAELIARGKYIVEDVAMCSNCHTPRLGNGQLDRSRWLAGGPTPFLPAWPASDWPINEPRLAGNPPATNEQMITLLTTAIWIDGEPLRDPMPKFHMTRADAEAVVAYLRSL